MWCKKLLFCCLDNLVDEKSANFAASKIKKDGFILTV